MPEQIIAKIEFDFARNADHDPAGQELENGFAAGNGKDQSHQLGDGVEHLLRDVGGLE